MLPNFQHFNVSGGSFVNDVGRELNDALQGL